LNLFLEEYFEPDSGAFEGGPHNFTVNLYGFAETGKIEFDRNLLADKQALAGIDENAARTDIINWGLEVPVHGLAICDDQSMSGNGFTGIFSSF
jgi:hypothetical protein